MLRSLAVFRRWPSWRWRPPDPNSHWIVPPEALARFPALAEEIGFLNEELLPSFRALDNRALQAQNQFRLEQVLIIFGTVLVTVLGVVQVAVPGSTWAGLTQAVLAVILAAVTWRSKTLKNQKTYFDTRLKAEALRGEFFLYLARAGLYAEERGRKARLVERVADIVREGATGDDHAG